MIDSKQNNSMMDAENPIISEPQQNNIKFNLVSEIKSIKPGTKKNFVCGVELELESVQTEDRQPVDILCLIDDSGSMQGNRANLVKQSLKFLLKILGKDDQVSLITFSDDARVLCPFVKNNDENKQQLKKAIKKITGQGGTDLIPGIKESLKLLQKRESKREQTFILLLTDGEFNRTDKLLEEIKSKVNQFELQRQFYVYTFGYGDAVNPVILQQIASNYEGKYCQISNVQAVTDWFLLTVSGLLKCACKEVLIKINETRKDLLRIQQTIGGDIIWRSQNQETRDFQIQVPLLFNGDKKCFVFECTFDGEFEVDDANRYQTVLDAQLTYSIVKSDGSKSTQSMNRNLTLEFMKKDDIKSEEEEKKMDIEQKNGNNDIVLNSAEDYYENLMVTFYRGLGGKVIQESSDLIQSNRDFVQAKKKLAEFEENLKANCKFLENKGIQHLLEDITDAIEKCHPQKYYRSDFQKMNAVHERRSRSRSHSEDWNDDNQNVLGRYRGGEIALSESESDSDDDDQRRNSGRNTRRRRSRSNSRRRRSRSNIRRRSPSQYSEHSSSVSQSKSRSSRSSSSSSSESNESHQNRPNRNQRSNRFRQNNRYDRRDNNYISRRSNSGSRSKSSNYSRDRNRDRSGTPSRQSNKRQNNYSNRNNRRRYSRARSPSYSQSRDRNTNNYDQRRSGNTYRRN